MEEQNDNAIPDTPLDEMMEEDTVVEFVFHGKLGRRLERKTLRTPTIGETHELRERFLTLMQEAVVDKGADSIIQSNLEFGDRFEAISYEVLRLTMDGAADKTDDQLRNWLKSVDGGHNSELVAMARVKCGLSIIGGGTRGLPL